MGEWCRNVLLDVAKNPAGRPVDLALLGEAIALRTIVANVVYYLATEGKVESEHMKAFIERADSTKLKRATGLLSQIVRSGKPDTDSKSRSAEAATP